MCMGGSKPPSIPATPLPAPTPTIVEPTEVVAISEDDRRKKLQKMRAGLASTIKTSPKGITGDRIDLVSGSIMGKEKLGQ